MACAWDSRNNLFANQFNVGADLAAATFILGKVRAHVHEHATRRTSARRCTSRGGCGGRVRAPPSPPGTRLRNRGSVTIFDVAPLLGALADDGHMSLLVPAECALEDGVFRLEESIGRCGVWATARAAGSVRAALLDMLRRCAATAAKRAREGDDGAGPSPKAARSNSPTT